MQQTFFQSVLPWIVLFGKMKRAVVCGAIDTSFSFLNKYMAFCYNSIFFKDFVHYRTSLVQNNDLQMNYFSTRNAVLIRTKMRIDNIFQPQFACPLKIETGPLLLDGETNSNHLDFLVEHKRSFATGYLKKISVLRILFYFFGFNAIGFVLKNSNSRVITAVSSFSRIKKHSSGVNQKKVRMRRVMNNTCIKSWLSLLFFLLSEKKDRFLFSFFSRTMLYFHSRENPSIKKEKKIQQERWSRWHIFDVAKRGKHFL